MKPLFNLIKKELRELLTPSSLLSVVVVVILLASLGSLIGGEVQKEANLQPTGYINYSAPGTPDDYASIAINYVKANYEAQGLVVDDMFVELNVEGYGTEAFADNLLKAMNEKNLNGVIIIPEDFNTKIAAKNPTDIPNYNVFWRQDSTGIFSALDTATTVSVISMMNTGISNTILLEAGVSPDTITFSHNPAGYTGSTFLKGSLKEGVSPDQIFSALSQQTMFIPIIIMIIIVMIGSILISSMGNEKENKTLETLLTLPINRTTIVSGKLIGSAIAGILMGAMYMIGMYFYINGMTSILSSGVSMDQLGLKLGAVDWVLVVLCVFLSILCALSMCMILGAFAKNYKAAQTYLLPISVLAMIPMFVTMFSSFGSLPGAFQVIMFIIPFTHPMMVIQNLMFGDVTLVIGGIIYLAVFAAVMIFITVRLYKSDILLTGLHLKKKKAEDKEEQ